MPHHLKNILLVGTGPMAVEYVKVLKDLGIIPSVIGRSQDSCDKFETQTQIKAFAGGLEANLDKVLDVEAAIICTGVEQLADCTMTCIKNGIKHILVEKPAGLSKEEIAAISLMALHRQVKVAVAYNRRFYTSVLKAKELILADGGVSSFNFEFTEWSHTIEPLKKAEGVKEQWLVANSSHVIDLAFFLGGEPTEIHSLSAGQLSWHSKSKFCGIGKTANGALFDYRANWDAPGRWGVEVLTPKNRYIFRPLEDLQIQTKGSVQILKQEIDDNLDKKYKAGLFLQTQSWINQTNQDLFIDIHKQFERFDTYESILNGNA
jgi:predicted dehydrogenase